MTAYAATRETQADLARRFTYHPPHGDQPQRYDIIRTEGHALAAKLADMCPPGRELSLALTNLEQVVMWANASIARGEKDQAPQ